MTADLLENIEGPTEADMEWDRGYDDGIAGREKAGTSPDYLDGYAEGRADGIDDYWDDYYNTDEEW